MIIHVSHRTPADIAGMYDEVVSVSQADFKEEGKIEEYDSIAGHNPLTKVILDFPENL